MFTTHFHIQLSFSIPWADHALSYFLTFVQCCYCCLEHFSPFFARLFILQYQFRDLVLREIVSDLFYSQPRWRAFMSVFWCHHSCWNCLLLGARGEGDDRGWDGWMASLTRWTWVWVNSGSWWCCDSSGRNESDMTEWLIWSDLIWLFVYSSPSSFHDSWHWPLLILGLPHLLEQE